MSQQVEFLVRLGAITTPRILPRNGWSTIKPMDAAAQRAQKEDPSIGIKPASVRSVKFKRSILPREAIARGTLKPGGLPLLEPGSEEKVSPRVDCILSPEKHLLL